MVSTVRSRPNHYDALGLAPTATQDEITRAFAREMGRPRTFGGIAQLSVAFETLRDPVKRRAYDASIGLGPEPEPEQHPAPTEWRDGKQFMMFAQARPGQQPARERPPKRPAPTVNAAPRPQPAPEPRMAAFMALASREPVNSDPLPEPPLQAQPQAEPRPEPPIARDPLIPPTEPHGLPEVEDGPIAWKRPAIAAGAFVAAVVLFGGWAGWEAGNDLQPAQQPERAVTVALPPAQALRTTESSPAPPPSVEQVRPEPRPRAVVAAVRVEPTTSPLGPAATEEQPVAASPFLDKVAQAIERPEAVAEPAAAPVTAAAAKLPLPNAVVARTIGRIGYACGQVVSTTAIDGEGPDVFRVTCTSGHSYRAAPVGGRYRFKRLGGG